MKEFVEKSGEIVFLDDAVEKHISKDHSEISLDMLESCLLDPDIIVKSQHHDLSELYFSLRVRKRNKVRFTLVVVKRCPDGLFVSTAMTRSKLKSGEILFKKEGFDENLL